MLTDTQKYDAELAFLSLGPMNYEPSPLGFPTYSVEGKWLREWWVMDMTARWGVGGAGHYTHDSLRKFLGG